MCLNEWSIFCDVLFRFVNHCFYFGILSPNDDEVKREPGGYLLEEINENFGSLDGLKEEIEKTMNQVRGSGEYCCCVHQRINYLYLSLTPGNVPRNIPTYSFH